MQWTRQHRLPVKSIKSIDFSDRSSSSKSVEPVIKNGPACRRSNFLSEPRAAPFDFQQIKFNDNRSISPWNGRRVSAVVARKLDLSRSDFAPHLSTSFRRWLRTNDWQEHLSRCCLWSEAPTRGSCPLSVLCASIIRAGKLIRLRRKPECIIYARFFRLLPSSFA